MSDDIKQPEEAPAAADEVKTTPGEDAVNKAAEEAAKLAGELEAAKQDVLYAKAETQNVRRRLEKEVADARAYASTGFARDVLSVSDNLARALDSIPAELRADEKF